MKRKKTGNRDDKLPPNCGHREVIQHTKKYKELVQIPAVITSFQG